MESPLFMADLSVFVIILSGNEFVLLQFQTLRDN